MCAKRVNKIIRLYRDKMNTHVPTKYIYPSSSYFQASNQAHALYVRLAEHALKDKNPFSYCSSLLTHSPYATGSSLYASGNTPSNAALICNAINVE